MRKPQRNEQWSSRCVPEDAACLVQAPECEPSLGTGGCGGESARAEFSADPKSENGRRFLVTTKNKIGFGTISNRTALALDHVMIVQRTMAPRDSKRTPEPRRLFAAKRTAFSGQARKRWRFAGSPPSRWNGHERRASRFAPSCEGRPFNREAPSQNKCECPKFVSRPRDRHREKLRGVVQRDGPQYPPRRCPARETARRGGCSPLGSGRARQPTLTGVKVSSPQMA